MQAYNANVSAQAAKTTAQEWAVKMDGQVSSTDYSSKYYAGNSKIWAEGTDEQVAALGGTHSAKVWAESAGWVTLGTTQTITGTKTFTTATYISRSGNTHLVAKRTDLATNATTPASNTYEMIEFSANDDSTVGRVFCQQLAAGENDTILRATKKVNGSNVNASIIVGVKSDGAIFTSVPTPTDTTATSSTQIATVGWVNLTGNNLVHLNSAETITGIKTFGAPPVLDNTVVAGPGIKFAASGVEKADLFWRDGYGFTMTTASGANYELLRIKDPSSTDKGPYAATTSWCRDSTLGSPDYANATEFVNQSNYTTNLPYTVPKNGWIDIAPASGSGITAAINGRDVGGITGVDTTRPSHMLYRVKTGDVVTRVNSAGTWGISFIPNANV